MFRETGGTTERSTILPFRPFCRKFFIPESNLLPSGTIIRRSRVLSSRRVSSISVSILESAVNARSGEIRPRCKLISRHGSVVPFRRSSSKENFSVVSPRTKEFEGQKNHPPSCPVRLARKSARGRDSRVVAALGNRPLLRAKETLTGKPIPACSTTGKSGRGA